MAKLTAPLDTENLVDALIGHARERVTSGDEYPVDNVWEWGDWTAIKRYEWASLLALRAGRVAEAQVFATLAQAAATDDSGFQLHQVVDELHSIYHAVRGDEGH
jgi:hypothetical protein